MMIFRHAELAEHFAFIKRKVAEDEIHRFAQNDGSVGAARKRRESDREETSRAVRDNVANRFQDKEKDRRANAGLLRSSSSVSVYQL
jgi:hypothetical protein